MKLTLTVRALVVAALGAGVLVAAGNANAVDPGRDDLPITGIPEIGIATFEGETLDLKQGWGDAQACYVDETFATTCFRTEQQMDALLGLDAATMGDYPSNANGYSSCGTSIKLYYYEWYGTPVLYLATRGTWTTLSWFGVDNTTSSYKMGSCPAIFKSGSYGGGSTYPGPTNAWSRRTTMGWGWDNVLSSLYIY